MYIATRAEVFVRNGVSCNLLGQTPLAILHFTTHFVFLMQFSSLTSNTVMLRMAHGVDPRDMHFW
jgi:hypothetical protein